MHSIQNSFSKKRVLHYDHYNRYGNNLSFEPRPDPYPPTPAPSVGRRPLMPSYDAGQASPPPLTSDPAFDILDWHPAYQSCQRFFLDHAQHEAATQALCALINIRLPFQYFNNPVDSSSSAAYSFNFPRPGGSPPNRPRNSTSQEHHAPTAFVSLIPYIRRLIVTGFDKPAILHGMFGDDYRRGIFPHLDCERRNYLFAAKHEGWGCKKQYDNGSGMGGDESVPFMKPLDEARVAELTAAEKAWSGWLAMEDWMVGPRAPKEDAEPERPASPPSRDRAGEGRRVNLADNLPDGVPETFAESGGVQTNGADRHENGDASEAVLPPE